MSYEICITRADLHWENAGREIALDEWAAVVARDRELESVHGSDDGAAVWTGHPDGVEVVFYVRDGNVFPDRVDDHVVTKTVHLAAALGGTAQGDDGETYGNGAANAAEVPAAPADGASNAGFGARVAHLLLEIVDVLRGVVARKPFRVGTRVRDHLFGEGVVVGYEYGPLTNIVVRFDDGREVRRAVLLDGTYTAGLERADAPPPKPPPPAPRTSCAVYERLGRLYVLPRHRIEAGMWIDGEAAVLDGDAPAAGVGAAILDALGASRTGEPDPDDLWSVGDALARQAGVAQWTTFARKARLVGVEADRPPGDRVTLTPHRRIRGSGFETVSDGAVEVVAEPGAVGEALLGLLHGIG